MSVQFAIALVIAIPVAVGLTRLAMAIAARYLEQAERWDTFCLGK